MSRNRRRHRSTARMVAWYLTAIAVIGVAALADELLRHGLLTVLALAGPVAGYVAGRMHGARLRRRAAQWQAVRGRPVEILQAEHDEGRQFAAGNREARAEPGTTRAQLLADPRSGARSLDGPR